MRTRENAQKLILMTILGLGTFSSSVNAATLAVIDGQTVNGETVVMSETQVVDAGGTTQNTTIDGGKQELYGTAETTTIINGGSQWIHAGGEATDTTIRDGALQQVYNDGTATNTVIDGGKQELLGTAITTTITNGGSQWVHAGGEAIDTTIHNGGLQQVYNDGTATDTVIDGGRQELYGTAVTTTITNDGSQWVHAGGEATDTTISAGGLQWVENGGTATDTVINGSGKQGLDGGSALNTQINDGGLQTVTNGALAEDTHIFNGGTQQISGGAPGTEGLATNTVVYSGGVQDIWSFGIADGTQIQANGIQAIHSTGIAIDTTVNGEQLIYSGGISKNTTVNAGGATHIMEDGTNLTGMTRLNGGAIVLKPASSDGSTFITARIEDLSGSGSFYMNTNLEAQAGDKIQISGTADGEHQIFVNNQGGASVDPTQALTIIETATIGTEDFTLGHQVEVGGYLYDIRRDLGGGMNWELFSTGSLSSSGEAAYGMLTGRYLLNYAENGALFKRVDELRESPRALNIWAKGFGGKFSDSDKGFLSQFKMTYDGLQVGMDRRVVLEDGSVFHLGAFMGQSKGYTNFSAGSGELTSHSLGAYGVYLGSKDFYSNLSLKYNRMKGNSSVVDTAGDLVKGKLESSDGITLATEIGQKFYLGNKEKGAVYLQPRGSLSAAWLGSSMVGNSNGLNVEVDRELSLLGGVGLIAGYEIKEGEKSLNLYSKISYFKEFEGNMDVRFNGASHQESMKDSWLVYGIGVKAQFSEKHALFFDIERASGGQFNQPWGISGTYQFSW